MLHSLLRLSIQVLYKVIFCDINVRTNKYNQHSVTSDQCDHPEFFIAAAAQEPAACSLQFGILRTNCCYQSNIHPFLML